jgi:hypothetical protein
MRGPLLALALLAALPAAARDHHVDLSATEGGSGTAAAPFASLAEAAASGALKGGDRLLLAPGNYGQVRLKGWRFSPALEIRSISGARAHMDRLWIQNGQGLVLTDLDVWPRKPQAAGKQEAVVEANASSSGIHFHRLEVRSAPEADGYYTWQAEDWLRTWRIRGVRLSGPDMSLTDSRITGVSEGIAAHGDRARILRNEVRGFSMDGMRGFGTDSLFQHNLIRDCIKVDENHDDGFQSWTAPPGQNGRPEIRNITLDGNRIFEWTGPARHPLRCVLQGVAMFDGPYVNWTIQNNLIVVSAPHGIAIAAGRDMQVLHNTVAHPDGTPGKAPWIRLSDGKRGQPAWNNVVAGNVANALHLGDAGPQWNRFNTIIRDATALFEAPARLDYRPRRDSVLVDAGKPDLAPARDLAGTLRGRTPDLGALER